MKSAIIIPTSVLVGFLAAISLSDAPPVVRSTPTPQPASEQVTLLCIEIDGLPIYTDSPVVDPRPICDASGAPIPFHYRLLWSNGFWVIGELHLHLYAHMTFNLGPYGGLFDYAISTPNVYGDVTGDGRVTTIDLAKVRRMSGVLAENPDRTICDLDRSGVVDETDEELCRQAIQAGI